MSSSGSGGSGSGSGGVGAYEEAEKDKEEPKKQNQAGPYGRGVYEDVTTSVNGKRGRDQEGDRDGGDEDDDEEDNRDQDEEDEDENEDGAGALGGLRGLPPRVKAKVMESSRTTRPAMKRIRVAGPNSMSSPVEVISGVR